MNILEHDPMTIFMTLIIKFGHGKYILTLTKGDDMELFIWINTLLPGEGFDIL